MGALFAGAGSLDGAEGGSSAIAGRDGAGVRSVESRGSRAASDSMIWLKACPSRIEQSERPKPKPVRRWGRNPNSDCVARSGVLQATLKPVESPKQFLA